MRSEHTPGRQEGSSVTASSVAARPGDAARSGRSFLSGAVLVLSLVSCFMEPPPVATVPQTTLTVNVAGDGTVTSDPAGIDTSIAAGGAFDFDEGTDVTLIATPAAGYDFGGWTGCDDQSGTICTLTMDADVTVEVAFAVASSAGRVVVNREGSGTVISEDGTLVCGQACESTFPQGTQVVLTAVASTGTAVDWSGACASATSEHCDVDVAERTEVGATFERIAAPAIGPLEAIGCNDAGLGDTCEVRIGWSGEPGPHSGIEFLVAGDSFGLVAARVGADAADCFVAHGPLKVVMACDSPVDGGTDVMRLSLQRTGSLPAVVAVIEAYLAPDASSKSSVPGGAFVAGASP